MILVDDEVHLVGGFHSSLDKNVADRIKLAIPNPESWIQFLIVRKYEERTASEKLNWSK